MFKKKKKKEVIVEEEVKVSNSVEDSLKQEKELEHIEVVEDILIVDNEIDIKIKETMEYIEGDFTFYDSDSSADCLVDEDEVVEEASEADIEELNEEEKVLEEEPVSKSKSEKKELDSYFEASKKDNSKIKIEPVKVKRKSKRKEKKETEFSNIKDQKVFVFRGKKYSKVDDFIKYLNNHYLEIDKVAEEVLADENFYGWLSKKSGVFNDSIKQFKEIKEKIEKK